MNPGSTEPMGGFAPQAMAEITIEDRYDWPLGDGIVVRLTFRHVDRLTPKHLAILNEYLATFTRAMEKTNA